MEANEFYRSGSDAAAPAPPARSPVQRVRRHILCSTGAAADLLAQRVAALSHCGMSDPPLEHLPLPAGVDDAALQQLAQQMEHACDRLADLERAQNHRDHGLAVATPDELHAWLLVQLGSHADGAAALATGAEPPTGGQVGAVAQCQAVLERTAWRRLRARIAWHIILLCEAADQAMLVQWSAALRAAAAGQEALLYVLSPVNADHLRLGEDGWREATAQSVAALLWITPPAHTQLERAAASPHSLAAIAACVWCSPARLLQTWLAQAGASQVLNDLHHNLAGASLAAPAPAPAPEEHLAALRRRCPPEQAQRPPTLRPSWPALAGLPARLADEAERRRATAAAAAQTARLAWLDEAQTAWSDQLARLLNDTLIAPAWPQAGACLGQLLAWRRELDAGAQVVGNRLEQIGEQLAQAEDTAAAAGAELETLCAGFPCFAAASALQALLQPWRWPGWAYDYWQRLPAAAQRTAAAQAALGSLQAEEALWHTLRQHMLAAAQQTQLQIGRLQQAQAALAAAAALAGAASAAAAGAIPAPWTPERLAWLLQRLLPDTAALPLRTILASALRAELSPELLVAQVQERLAGEVNAVAAWSALDCLAAAFVPAASSGTGALAGSLHDPASLPLRWLAQRLHATAPWWPAQELAENSLAEAWWSLPDPHGQGEWLAASSALAEACRLGFGQLDAAHSALDAVQLIRWAEVRIDLEAPSACEPGASGWQEEDCNDHGSLA